MHFVTSAFVLNASVSQCVCLCVTFDPSGRRLFCLRVNGNFSAFRESVIRNDVIDVDVSRNSKFIFLVMM